MLITQYILNLDKRNYTYIGSGTVVLSGSASASFTPAYGNYSVQFFLGEWVYDYSHNVWQIIAIQGTVQEPIYVATRQDVIKQFIGSELVKFNNETSVFNNVFDNNITKYQEALDRLNSLVFLTAAPPAENNFTLEFQVGDYVFDYKQDVWQIIAVQGSVGQPVFVGTRLNQKKEFYQNEIVKFSNQSSVYNKIYDARIAKYQKMIDQLNSL